MSHEILLSDAIEGLKGLDDGSVDLIVTDPAYSSLEKHRASGTTTRLAKSKASSNEWFPVVPNEYFWEFFRECYRVLKRPAHIYVMCDEETSDAIKPMLRAAGFEMRKSVVWHKVGKMRDLICPHCGQVCGEIRSPGIPGMGYPFRSQYELILLGQKGKRPAPKDRSIRNVLEVPWIKDRDAYPTEKPVELVEILLKQSSQEGDLVCDPFAGSGSTGEAAFNLRREFVGFDVQQDAIDYFEQRKKNWVESGEYVIPPDANNILGFFQAE